MFRLVCLDATAFIKKAFAERMGFDPVITHQSLLSPIYKIFQFFRQKHTCFIEKHR